MAMTDTPNKSLQATGAAPSVLDGVGDWLLPGFVVALFPAPVPELTSEVIRQRIFQDFFTGFLKGLLPSSTLSNKATSGLPCLRSAAS